MATDVVKNIIKTCNNMGQVQLGSVKLESGDASLLNPNTFTLDEHVAMQPSAIAYYGALKKEASRRLAALTAQHDRWSRKQYALAKAAVESGTSNKSYIKVEDIKSRFVLDNEPEIVRREAQVQQAQMEYDTLDVWYEAWKQKSFSIRETVSIDEDERYNSSSSLVGKSNHQGEIATPSSVQRVRELIRKRQSQAQGAA